MSSCNWFGLHKDFGWHLFDLVLVQFHKLNVTLEQIQFHIETNPISLCNKSNFILEQIHVHIGTNPISQWNKSNFALEQIQFHMWKNHGWLLNYSWLLNYGWLLNYVWLIMYVGKLPKQYFSLWLFSNPGGKIVFLLKFNEARISQWKI